MSGAQVPITGMKKGWQQAGKLKIGDPVQAVTLQADFQNEPGNYTIQFGIVKPPNANALYVAKADIYWSVEGQTLKRTITVGNGVSISGTAQGVKVRVYDDTATTFPAAVIVPNTEYTVAVQVVKGTRPNVGKPPTLYVAPVNVGPLSFQNINIPADAGVISVNVQIGVAAVAIIPIPFTAQCIVEDVGGLTTLTTFVPTENNAGFITLPPGSAILSLYNGSAGDTYTMQVNFGIDG